MKFSIHLLLLVLLCPLAGEAEVWTSVKGERFFGDFIRYDLQGRKVVIRRDYDRRVFEVDETLLIYADRLRAVKLQNADVIAYWYTDYDKARTDSANRDRAFILLCRNGSDKEAFELFYHKLLLRKEFQELLEANRFAVCVLEDVPQAVSRLNVSQEKEYKRWLAENLPMVFSGVREMKMLNGELNGELTGASWFRLKTEGKALQEGDDFTPYRHIEESVKGYWEDVRKSEEEVRAMMEAGQGKP